MLRPIAFYPELAKVLGSIEAAIYFQQLHYWRDKGAREDGFIYKTKDEIEQETYITPRQQDVIRKMLIKKGWIEVKRIKANGVPVLHYKVLTDINLIITKSMVGTEQNVRLEPNKLLGSITDTTTNTTTGSGEQVSTPAKRSLKTKERSLIWTQNEEYIKDNLERYKKIPIQNVATGLFGFEYLLNEGRTTPDKLFGAIYWQEKERLSGGAFAYRFSSRERAWECFSSEQKFASKLASVLTVKEFKEKLLDVNDKAWNEKLGEYDYEWKLSTILKNLRT